MSSLVNLSTRITRNGKGSRRGGRKEWASNEAERRVRCWLRNINKEIQRKKNEWIIKDPRTGYKGKQFMENRRI